MPRKRKINVAPKHANAAVALKDIPKEHVLEVLEGSGDMRMVQLSYMIQDGKYGARSLAELCAMNGIGVKDVAKVIEEQHIAFGQIERAKHLPAVLETNAVAAKGKPIPCPTCRGKKRISETCERCDGEGVRDEEPCKACTGMGVIDAGPCLTCSETGWVAMAGDPNALKYVMESTGLSAKGGINVSVTQNNANFSGAGSFEDLMRDAEKKQIVEVKAE